MMLSTILPDTFPLQLVELVEQHALDALDPRALHVHAGGRYGVHLGTPLPPYFEFTSVALY